MFNDQYLPTINAQRISLRWLTNADVADLFEIFSNAEAMQYWSSPPYKTASQAQQLLDHIHESFAKKDLFQWGIEHHQDRRIIGTCTLLNICASSRRAEIGYMLSRRYWRQGYMQEMLTTLINYCFNELNLNRLEADVDPRNSASMGLLEKLGFQKEGYMRERWIFEHDIQDTVFYGLLRRDWLNRI